MKQKIVKAKVRAIETGYYNNEIINVGREFIYEGPLNKQGKLPLWTEAVDEEFYERLNVKEEVKVEEAQEVSEEVEAEAPKKPKKASTKKASLADSIV